MTWIEKIVEGIGKAYDPEIWKSAPPSALPGLRQVGSVARWNTGGTLVFYDKEACDFPIEPPFMVAEDENFSKISDEDLWAEYWDSSEVRRFIEVSVPSIYANEKDPGVATWRDELELAMSGKAAKRKIAWPVVLLLATRE